MKGLWYLFTDWLEEYLGALGFVIIGFLILIFIIFSPILIPLCELGDWIFNKFNKKIK